MKRRSFIQKSSSATVAISLLPNLFIQEEEYSVLELMGKEDIKLYGEGINLRKEAHDAFLEMKKAAYSDGIDLKIVSSYRDFSRQEGIFERKFINYTDEGMEPIAAIEKIIEYSTIPGTSRHHWGTDADIIDGYRKVEGDVLDPEKYGNGGPYEDFKLWMDENSETYGYHLVYTDEPKRRGFKYEPWHYSYAPLSIPMLEAFRGKNIIALLETEQFYGAEHFTRAFLRRYIQNNILDINRDLL
ncbi:M15 family metallopeptidase [Maribacter sp. PR1]|uniref:M15 family metallopeptidase n=1 Tax=Maribacter cobaltidurans TaxID=1178778 RepID=A0ABU7IYE6_9FLAO|nr:MULTISPECIES: M15 family metallopeptidase [Maribacter]MDC6390193.1 M15 family metallopeptidase [Maribacter sp. PR1]MEE1977583.1 M15 family metallopeptidase [Maribacter cobaltidurans]